MYGKEEERKGGNSKQGIGQNVVVDASQVENRTESRPDHDVRKYNSIEKTLDQHLIGFLFHLGCRLLAFEAPVVVFPVSGGFKVKSSTLAVSLEDSHRHNQKGQHD